jgi:hypothetical protein
MSNIFKVTSVALLASISQLAYSAPITDTYTTGDTLTATTLGNIKSAVNDNDSRVTTNAAGIASNTANITSNTNAITNDLAVRLNALETGYGQSVAIDCATDSSALLNSELQPGNTYILTGMCDGPIEIDEPAGVYRFQGDAIGSKDDGISLPAGHVQVPYPKNGYTVITYGPVAAKFVNLTISATDYTSSLDLWVNTLWATGNSSIILTDVDVVGGDTGVFAEQSQINIRDGVAVIGFRAYGLYSFRGSSILVNDPITVTGLQSEPGDESFALLAARGGTLETYGGGSFTAGTDDGSNSSFYNGSVGVWDNGIINIGEQGPVILNGAIRVGRSSSSRIKAGTITGELWVNKGSILELHNVTHSTGDIDITDSSILAVRTGTTLSSGSSDPISVNRLSEIHFFDGAVGNLSGTAIIDLNHYSLMQAKGGSATDFNSRDINCSNSLFIQTNVTQVGTVTGC